MEADRFETVQKGTILSFFTLFLTVILIIYREKKLATLTLVNEKCVHMHISFLHKFAEDFAASMGHFGGPSIRQFDIFLYKPLLLVGLHKYLNQQMLCNYVIPKGSKLKVKILCKHTK